MILIKKNLKLISSTFLISHQVNSLVKAGWLNNQYNLSPFSLGVTSCNNLISYSAGFTTSAVQQVNLFGKIKNLFKPTENPYEIESSTKRIKAWRLEVSTQELVNPITAVPDVPIITETPTVDEGPTVATTVTEGTTVPTMSTLTEGSTVPVTTTVAEESTVVSPIIVSEGSNLITNEPQNTNIPVPQQTVLNDVSSTIVQPGIDNTSAPQVDTDIFDSFD